MPADKKSNGAFFSQGDTCSFLNEKLDLLKPFLSVGIFSLTKYSPWTHLSFLPHWISELKTLPNVPPPPIPEYIKQHPGSTEPVYDILILSLHMSLIINIKEHLHMNSYGQIPQRSIQDACTCIQPQSLQEVVLKHKSLGRAVTWGERRQTQIELMLLALNEDQPELYTKGQPAESVWDASHLQATGTESALTHITTHQLPNWAPILTSTEAGGLHQWVTSLHHQDHCSHSVWPPTDSALWSDSHRQIVLSSFQQDQCASSCLSIFNYPVKLHYTTCTKSHPSDN